jgi:hypothetical protein
MPYQQVLTYQSRLRRFRPRHGTLRWTTRVTFVVLICVGFVVLGAVLLLDAFTALVPAIDATAAAIGIDYRVERVSLWRAGVDSSAHELSLAVLAFGAAFAWLVIAVRLREAEKMRIIDQTPRPRRPWLDPP